RRRRARARPASPRRAARRSGIQSLGFARNGSIGRPAGATLRAPRPATFEGVVLMFAPGLRFGIFLAPFHPVHENPQLALRRDFELIEWLDHLGYDEAWIGEHHSAGYEIIASPELFIAAAAERTERIRLGTGVSSLPYHHPLMLADRINQLDHMTRGR